MKFVLFRIFDMKFGSIRTFKMNIRVVLYSENKHAYNSSFSMKFLWDLIIKMNLYTIWMFLAKFYLTGFTPAASPPYKKMLSGAETWASWGFWWSFWFHVRRFGVPCWLQVGRSGAILAPSWGVKGHVGSKLGASWLYVESPWGHLVSKLVAPWVHFGSKLGVLGAIRKLEP